MKKLLVLLFCCIAISCAKAEPAPVIDGDSDIPQEPEYYELAFSQGQETDFTLSEKSTSFTVSFVSSHRWTADVMDKPSWLTLYPHYGDKGENKINVLVDENETLDKRDASLKIECGDKSLVVFVHQTGRDRLKFTYTGAELEQPITQAYDDFLKNDLMPTSIEVCGEILDRGKYFEAMLLLLSEISKGGEEWKTHVYSNLKCRESSVSNSTKFETYAPDSLDVETVLWINERQYNYSKNNNNLLANYCTVDNSCFSLTRSIVVTARVLHHYFITGSLPDKVSSWQSDFLRDIGYNTDSIKDKECSLLDPVVTEARDKSIAGKNTTMEKAVAIFEYARDVWEWEDYYDSKKGAKAVIQCKGGNCCDLSHGIIAMARSAGIPARYVHGPETYYPSGSVWGHVWTELYVDGQWYICDASNNNSAFGKPTWSLEKTKINGKYKNLPF